MLETIIDSRDTAIKVTDKVPTVMDITWWGMGKQASKHYIYIFTSEHLRFCG